MTAEMMNDLVTSVPLFCKNMASLKDTSRDKQGAQNVTESDALAVNFDRVMEGYSLKEECLSSMDALALLDNRLVLIEFKNGEVRERELWRKVKSSLLAFCDLTGKPLQFTREYMDLYVVCSELDSLAYREKIERAMGEKANNDKYHLRKRYCGLYFRDVRTYSKEEFKQVARRIRPISFPKQKQPLA